MIEFLNENYIEKMRAKHLLISSIYLLSTALILCIPAFYNRYVIFYTDSALYLESAMNLIPTIDRPIGYSFFIRATTWKTSLWLTVFFQGLIGSLLIFHSLKTIISEIKFKRMHHFFTICFLTVFSTLGWYVGLLMPDVLTSFMIIAVFNMLFGKNNLITYIFYVALFFFIIFSHLSNIPLLAAILLIFYLFKIIRRKREKITKNTIIGTAIIVFVYLGTLAYIINYNYRHFSKAQLSPTGNIFFFARLIDTGVVDKYLEDNCDKANLRICQYKDSIPNSSQFFLWHTDGIFYKMGGWNNYQQEPQIIVNDILTSPKYYNSIVWDFTISTCKQLFAFKIGGDFLNFVDGAWSPVYDKCVKSFPKNEIKRDFRYTKQAQEEFNFDTLNDTIYFFVIISLLFIVIVLYKYKTDEKVFYFLVISFSGILVNAFVCANLSNVLNRYQARSVWIIPFVALVLFFNYVYPDIRAVKKSYFI